jgi:hypothetical protein
MPKIKDLNHEEHEERLSKQNSKTQISNKFQMTKIQIIQSPSPLGERIEVRGIANQQFLCFVVP